MIRISSRDNNPNHAEFEALTKELGGVSNIAANILKFVKQYPNLINAILGQKTSQASMYQDAGIRDMVQKYKKQIRWIMLFMAMNGVKMGNARELEQVLTRQVSQVSQQA